MSQRVVIDALTKRLPRRNKHVNLAIMMRVKSAITELKGRQQSAAARGEV